MADHELHAEQLIAGPATFGEVRVTVHSPLPADHPFYAKVGHIASEWAHFEHILDLIIWEMAGVEPAKGACITASIMGHGGRCNSIASLGGLAGISPQIIKRIRSLKSDAFSVADARARIVHDPWYIERGSEQVSQFRSMPFTDPTYGMKDITDAAIAETIRRIQVLKETAGGIRNDVLAELDALRRGRP
jgi:hypothetical protein